MSFGNSRNNSNNNSFRQLNKTTNTTPTNNKAWQRKQIILEQKEKEFK